MDPSAYPLYNKKILIHRKIRVDAIAKAAYIAPDLNISGRKL